MASWVYDIECLDDLYRKYYEGEIDNNTFSLLLDAYNTGGLYQLDLEAIGALERNDYLETTQQPLINRFWSDILSAQTGRIGLRRYSKELDNINNYYFLNWQIRPVKVLIELKNSDDKNLWTKRRLSWSVEPLDIVIGNYTTAEGYGLTIGRFDYRPSAGLDNDTESDFIYPLNSYYNGVKFSANQSNLGGRLYYSDKEYATGRKTFIGSGFDFNIGRQLGWITAGYNRFRNEGVTDNRLAVGLGTKIKTDDFSLSGEYANIEKSNGLFIRGEREWQSMVFSLEYWRYDDDFDSYNCSGPSASDYRSFYPREQALGFRSAQAGETGLALNYIKQYYSFGLMFWSHSLEDRINLSYNFRIRKPFTDRLNVFLISSAKTREGSKYLWLKTGFIRTDNSLFKQTGVKLYLIDRAAITNTRSYSFMSFSKSLKQNFNIFFKIRNYFDGQIRWFLGEELASDNGLNIAVEAAFYKGMNISIKIEKLL